MQKSLVLFTFQFPYGKQETFLESELEFLKDSFESVIILPLFGADNSREVTDSINILPPVFKTRKSSFLMITSIMFFKVLFLGLKEDKVSLGYLKKLIKQSLVVSGLMKYLKRNVEILNSDLWYFYWGTNSVNILPFLKKHPKAIARFHRFDLLGEDVSGGEYQVFRRELFKRLDALIPVSNDGEKYLVDNCGVNSQKVHCFKLGTFDKGVGRSSQSDTLNIVSCSNIIPLKRVSLIAQAISKISDFPIHWTHFGDGDESETAKINNIIQNLPSNISVDMKGRVSNQEVLAFYKKNPCDLFINVSTIEGIPVSIMEALSFGIPVMATDCGGTSEIVNTNTGVLLNRDLNESDLTAAIKQFYSSHFQNIELRTSARTFWSQHYNAQKNYTLGTRFLLEKSGI